VGSVWFTEADGAAPQVETSPTTPLTPILIEPGDEAETILLSQIKNFSAATFWTSLDPRRRTRPRRFRGGRSASLERKKRSLLMAASGMPIRLTQPLICATLFKQQRRGTQIAVRSGA
jgi:hypothetical protein